MRGITKRDACYFDQPKDSSEFVPAGQIVTIETFVGEDNEYAVIRYDNRNRLLKSEDIKVDKNGITDILTPSLINILKTQETIIIGDARYEKCFKFIANELPCYATNTAKAWVKSKIEDFVSTEMGFECELVEGIEGWKIRKK